MLASNNRFESAIRTSRTFAAAALFGLLAMACGVREPSPSARAADELDACAVILAPHQGETDVDRQIDRLQQRIGTALNNKALVEQLGWLYVTKARATSDAGFWRLAGMAADCIDDKPRDNPAALLLKGHVLHNLHRFDEAERVARRLISLREAPFDHGLLGDALLEQGRLDEAGTAYQRMLDLKPSLHSYSRAAHLRWLRGDLPGALGAMEMAAGASSPRDPASAAWVYTRLAGFQLQMSQLADATRAVEVALGFEPEYAPAFFTKGRILLAQQQTEDALGPLRRAAERNPSPEYLWTLADALREAGRDEEAATWETKLERTGASEDRRTYSLYLATRGREAARSLELARQELESRSDVFTHDAIAWALNQTGETESAYQAMQRALEQQTEDARLFLHAGVIAAENGKRQEAADWLRRAEAGRQTLLPSERKHLVALSTSLRASPPSL